MGNVTIPGDVMVGDPGHVSHHDAIHRALAGAQARSSLTVASVNAPESVKDLADYVCDGVADQVQINAALLAATRPADGFGGTGLIEVRLVGETFNLSDSVKMPPSVTLAGGGRGTLLQPPTGSYVDKGAIELYNGDSHRTTVHSLTIGRTNAVTFAWHGIKYIGNPDGDTYEIKSGNDSYQRVYNVGIHLAAGKGIWAGGAGGANGQREMQLHDITIINPLLEGVHIDGASDSKLNHIVVTGRDGTRPGFLIAGGNTMTSNCKAFFRGNYNLAPNLTDGFHITSSRCMLLDCEAQDNARYGFNIESASALVEGCYADSNSAQTTGGAGFRIASAGKYSVLAVNRPQNTINQNTGIILSGSPQVHLDAFVAVETGTGHITGSAGANSFVRVVRAGSTVLSVG